MSNTMHVAVADIGTPGKSFGWAIAGPTNDEGEDVDEFVRVLADALAKGPLALGFEAPLFVPSRNDPMSLTKARVGECVDGVSRPFSIGAGATVLVIGLVVTRYILAALHSRVSNIHITFDWRAPLTKKGQLLLFEAFVTNQRKTTPSRHVEDAKLAIGAFMSGMKAPHNFKSAIKEESCVNLIAAVLLHSELSSNVELLKQPCLVVRG